ncbi:metallophosphoesterase [Paraburkholderia denitrificans]|uniref:Metallophosphoesterase n=1 Tax=Paraburkholderia denitrificans TaxID=694025 RepID=A0ABW0J8Y2_9BURK
MGDIHGCFSLLDAELQTLGFDPERDRLFSVGDLVDRGEESDAVLEAVSRYGIKAVRGNHEQGILDWMALNGDGPSPQFLTDMRADPYHAISEWAYRDGPTRQLASNGGEWFIKLYGTEDMGWNRAQAIARYFAALPYAIEIETEHGQIGIVHADVPFASWYQLLRALTRPTPDDSTREQLLWDRRRWKLRAVADHIEGVTAVIAGHTPTHDVAQCGNLINIDTGAVYGNKLTILNLSDVRGELARGDRGINGRPGSATLQFL